MWMGWNRPSSWRADEAAMFEDLSKIQFALTEHCFEHLQAWQRIVARWMLTLTARTVATKPYSPSCSGVWLAPASSTPDQEPGQAAREASTVREMIQRSYDRDSASQK